MTKTKISTFKELIHNADNISPNVLIDDFKNFLMQSGLTKNTINISYGGSYISGFQKTISQEIQKYISTYGLNFEQDIEQIFVYNVLSTNVKSLFNCSLILEFWDEIITSAMKTATSAQTIKTLNNYRSGYRKFVSYIISSKLDNDGKCISINPKFRGINPTKNIIPILKKEVKKLNYDADTIKSIFKSRLRTQRRKGLPIDALSPILNKDNNKPDLSDLLNDVASKIIFYYYDANNKINHDVVGNIKTLIFDISNKKVFVEIKNETFPLATEIFNPNNNAEKSDRPMACKTISDIHIDHIIPVAQIKQTFIIIPQIEKGVEACGSLDNYIESLSEDKLKKLQDNLYKEIESTFYIKEGAINLQLMEASENLKKSDSNNDNTDLE